MKKVTRVLGLMSMAGLLVFATSCNKNKDTNTSVNVAIPSMNVVSVDGERAYINEDCEFQWNQQDYIMVYNLADPANADESVLTVFHNTTGEGPTANFAGSDVGAKLPCGYFYFYPTNMVSGDPTELMEDNRQTFTVSNTQNFQAFEAEGHSISLVDASQMPMAINTEDLHADATLKHIFGVAQICLKGKSGDLKTVESITITDNAFNLWGTASMKLHAVNTDELQALVDEYKAGDANYATHFAEYVIGELGYESNGQGKSITLDCMTNGTGVTLLPAPYAAQFNFMLRPLALSQGFTVDVTFTDREPLHIDRWAQPNLAYSIVPGIINTWNYPTVIR